MTISLDQFLAQHLGHFVYFPGVPGAQCVALSQAYVRDVWGLPHTWGNAVDIFGEMPAAIVWERNAWGNPASRPKRGDLVVWHSDHYVGTGIYGHIDICTDPGDGFTFTGADQNWPPGSVVHYVKHSYFGVTGWGRPRSSSPPPIPAPPGGPPGGAGSDGAGFWEQLLSWLARLLGLDRRR